jgi:hypothetical protein
MCITDATDLLLTVPAIFAPCPLCRAVVLDKERPPPIRPPSRPCSCGRRYIDEIFLDLYRVFREERIFSGKEPLRAVGSPLPHPGFPMKGPPFIGERRLVLLSRDVNHEAAIRVLDEIPEIKGVVKTGPFVPGRGPDGRPMTYRLLSGCDVRADLFFSSAGPVAVYKQQSRLHIEFPRPRHEKGERLVSQLSTGRFRSIADLCSGAGTLGLIAIRTGIRHAILNDAWYAAAFWSGINMEVNQAFFATDPVKLLHSYKDLEKRNSSQEAIKIAESNGSQKIEVWVGDYSAMAREGRAPAGCLGILDLFDKRDVQKIRLFEEEWRRLTGGEVFIP